MKEKITKYLQEARLNKFTDKEKENVKKRGFNPDEVKNPKELKQRIGELPTIYYFNASFKPVQVGEDGGEPIYKKRLNIERFLKFDPEDPQNSNRINGMKMRTRFQSELKTYIVTTTQDLLDDFVGKSGNDIPDFVLKSIQERMKEL